MVHFSLSFDLGLERINNQRWSERGLKASSVYTEGKKVGKKLKKRC